MIPIRLHFVKIEIWDFEISVFGRIYSDILGWTMIFYEYLIFFLDKVLGCPVNRSKFRKAI